MTDVGTGAKIAFGTSLWDGNIQSMSWGGISRVEVPTKHLLTVGGETFIVGDLYNPGELTVEIQYDPDDRPPWDQVPETITITYPIPSGGSTGATHAATGFIKDFVPGQLDVDGLMVSTFVIKFSGNITFVAST